MTISPDSDPYSKIKVEVNSPKLHNCQGHKFVDYEIKIETSNRAFFRKYSVVRRRYSGFCWLRAKLSSTEINGFNRSGDIPSLPPKNYFGRFDRKLIFTRQQGLQDFLDKIVVTNSFLSFAGLHLFLQTQLTTQEIERFLDGSYGEETSVEDLVTSHELASKSSGTANQCSDEECVDIVFPNEENPSMSEANGVDSDSQEFDISGSSTNSAGFPADTVKQSLFVYSVYK